MSIISTFLELSKIAASSGFDKLEKMTKSAPRNQSVAKLSADAICQFPMYISDTVGIETAMDLTKMLESETAIFMQLAMGMNNQADDADIAKYIKKFHTNRATADLAAGYAGAKGSIQAVQSAVSEANIYALREYESPYNMRRLNEVAAPSTTNINVSNSNMNATDGSSMNVNIDINKDPSKGQRAALPKKLMLDTDVRKANQSNATMMQMNVIIANDGKEPIIKDFIFGVKTVLHPVSGDSMITEIGKCINKDNALFNFIKATTGEVNFIKDYLLLIKDAKEQAVNTRTNGKWASKLRADKLLSKLPGTTVIPNATVAITNAEKRIIESENSVTLDDRTINEIMAYYHLFSFVIVNELSGYVIVYYNDGRPAETVSLGTLENNNKSHPNEVKTIATILKARSVH